MGFRQLWNEGQEHAMELKLADNPTIEIVSEKAFLDALEKTNADALETLSEKHISGFGPRQGALAEISMV